MATLGYSDLNPGDRLRIGTTVGVLRGLDAIRFTLLSFMFASRNSKVCDKLRIVVSPYDY